MFNLQEKLIELSQYNVTFNVANGNFIIRVKYKTDWDIIKPANENISFYRDENDELLYYYVAPISITIDEIFYAIDETILFNKELEEKVILFNEKVKELQTIFAKESIETLNTLEFKVKRKKEKKKDKSSLDNVNDTIIEVKEKTNENEVVDEKTSEIDEKINAVLKEE